MDGLGQAILSYGGGAGFIYHSGRVCWFWQVYGAYIIAYFRSGWVAFRVELVGGRNELDCMCCDGDYVCELYEVMSM